MDEEEKMEQIGEETTMLCVEHDEVTKMRFMGTMPGVDDADDKLYNVYKCAKCGTYVAQNSEELAEAIEELE